MMTATTRLEISVPSEYQVSERSLVELIPFSAPAAAVSDKPRNNKTGKNEARHLAKRKLGFN